MKNQLFAPLLLKLQTLYFFMLSSFTGNNQLYDKYKMKNKTLPLFHSHVTSHCLYNVLSLLTLKVLGLETESTAILSCSGLLPRAREDSC